MGLEKREIGEIELLEVELLEVELLEVELLEVELLEVRQFPLQVRVEEVQDYLRLRFTTRPWGCWTKSSRED